MYHQNNHKQIPRTPDKLYNFPNSVTNMQLHGDTSMSTSFLSASRLQEEHYFGICHMCNSHLFPTQEHGIRLFLCVHFCSTLSHLN